MNLHINQQKVLVRNLNCTYQNNFEVIEENTYYLKTMTTKNYFKVHLNTSPFVGLFDQWCEKGRGLVYCLS